MTARSLSILLPAAMGHDANRMLEAAGLGPHAFSVLCYATGGLMIGLHAWEAEASRYTAPAEPEDGWEARGLTGARVAQITGAMVVSDLPLDGPVGAEAFEALTIAQGVGWGARLPMLPEAGSGATVTAGEFYRTAQTHFPVVRVTQTHARHDPTHIDLAPLRALFELIRDPWVPAPWLQPEGAHDAYQPLNIIGGPQLVTHEGQVWRCIAANNVWAPAAHGWEIQS